VTGPLVSPLSRDRLEGATAQAKKQGAERDFVVMNGDFSIESGAVAASRLLARREPPTAIFCFNDEMAMGVYMTAHREGIRIPCRSVGGWLRRYPLCGLHGAAAHDDRAADARNR
jgi:LacI family repressor for deo operon, udp, cdd, tsx, nupC, and nupG